MIAVLGATGRIGAHVSAALAAAGDPARALVRDPRRTRLALPAVAADLREPEALRNALYGADRFFCWPPMVPTRIYSRRRRSTRRSASASGAS